MSNTSSGHRAEIVAANYLEMRGFSILELNWRRPMCEVDIIARKDKVIYFVEVKYRKNDHQGSGFDYINPAKLSKMERGARMWVEESRHQGEYQLSAIEVAGPTYVVEHFIENAF